LLAGPAHPILGIDHLLALLAMGLWSATMAMRARLITASGIALLLAASALAGAERPHSTMTTRVPTGTCSKSSITDALVMRTQPSEAGCPIRPSSSVPWM